MAAKFSMADPAGLFGAEAHAEAADRLQDAAEELRNKHARADAASARAEQQQAAIDKERARRQRQALEAQAAAEPDPNVVRAAPEQDAEASDSDDDELLDEDPELERCVLQCMWTVEVDTLLAYLSSYCLGSGGW